MLNYINKISMVNHSCGKTHVDHQIVFDSFIFGIFATMLMDKIFLSESIVDILVSGVQHSYLTITYITKCTS